jgi:hypothetical protein
MRKIGQYILTVDTGFCEQEIVSWRGEERREGEGEERIRSSLNPLLFARNCELDKRGEKREGRRG